MKFQTISGSTYEIINRWDCLFLLRKSDDKLKRVKANFSSDENVEIYRIEFIPKIIVGKSAIFYIVQGEKVYEVGTSRVISISME